MPRAPRNFMSSGYFRTLRRRLSSLRAAHDIEIRCRGGATCDHGPRQFLRDSLPRWGRPGPRLRVRAPVSEWGRAPRPVSQGVASGDPDDKAFCSDAMPHAKGESATLQVEIAGSAAFRG